jgi:ribonuclease HI
MGKASDHTIYEAELVGLLLGMQLIKTERKGKVKCVLGADNQAVIKALQSELTNLGQHLAAEFLRLAGMVSKNRKGKSRHSGDSYGLTVQWTVGHRGIKGNEEADKAAKSAVQGESSPPSSIPIYI